jgi:hypothetical protein
MIRPDGSLTVNTPFTGIRQMTEIELYDRVRFVTSDYESEGVTAGMAGYVIEMYPDGNYEVEVSDPDTGETVAQFAVTPTDVVKDEPS